MAEAAKKKKIFDGRYEVLSIVGRGAASVVYHARHVDSTNSEVALKVLAKRPQQDVKKPAVSDLLRKEALAMVSARHKYVVRLDDFHSIGDLCYLAMEFAALGDLRKFISGHGGKLPAAVGELFFQQAAEGLDFVHRVGIIHRDIKPDNILVMSEKDIRLADFGVAVLPGESASIKELQAGIGTMSYMAPEVLEGIAYDKRSDIYSLGVAFYEMFSGIHPFDKAPLIKQLEIRQDHNITPLNVVAAQTPAHIVTVIMQAMSYDPAKRFASCQDLLQALAVNKNPSSKESAPIAVKMEPSAPLKPVSLRERPTAKASPVAEIVNRDPSVSKAPQSDEISAVDRTIRIAPSLQKAPAPIEEMLKKDDQEKEKPNLLSTRPGEFQEPENEQRIHPAIENRKPKRSLEDLRRLARESKGKDSSSDEKSNRSQTPIPPRRNQSRSLFQLIIFAIIGLAGAYILYSRFFAAELNQSNAAAPKTMNSPIPTTSPESISFPELSNGVYHGIIRDFMLDSPIPISLVSMGTARGIIVILGVPGWTPQIVQPEGGTDSIRVASNGFIIDLKGSVKDEIVSGQVSNLVTGEKGTWLAQRNKK